MDPDLDPSFQIKAQKLLNKCAHIPYILACHQQIDVDPDPVPDPAYHFDVDPDADPDPDFYLMRMRIRVTKMMRIRIHNTDSFMPRKVLSVYAVLRIRIISDPDPGSSSKNLSILTQKNGF